MSSIVISGDTSGTITIAAPAVSGTTTLTLPASTGTVMVNGPAFSAYTTSTTSVTNATLTKITLNAKLFDTNNNFDSTTNYRFTPTVAGYYQVNAVTLMSGSAAGISELLIYKNGSTFTAGCTVINVTGGTVPNASSLVYLNGSTDYIELYVYQTSGSTLTVSTTYTQFSASMTRSA